MPAERPKSLQEQKREFTRSRILDAAFEMFGKKGYDATTADDIATAAGCSRQAFYLHFNSKSMATIELLDRVWWGVDAAATEITRAAESGRTKTEMRAGIGERLAHWLPRPGSIGALNVAVLTDPVVSEWFDARSSTTYDVLARIGTGRSSRLRRRRRAQVAALSRMTLAAFTLVDGRHQESKDWEKDIVDYLTDLWADLLIVEE